MLNNARLEMLTLLDSLGTVRAVATALHMSPSAVSAQLAVLEAEARAELLRRTGRRVRLTPAGQTLARHARIILDQMKAAEAELRGPAEQPAGPVRLAAFSSAVRTLVLPLAARLRRTHPRIELTVTELDPQRSHPALRRGDQDLIVTADFIDGSTPIDPDVHTVPLLIDAVVLVLPPDRAGAGTPADLADFAGEPWSVDLPGTYLSNLVGSCCRQAGFEPIVAGRFGSYDLLLAHVEAGLSVSLLPELAVDRGRVAIRPLREPLTRQVYAAVRSRAALTAASRVVLDELRRGTAPPEGRGRSVREPDQ